MATIVAPVDVCTHQLNLLRHEFLKLRHKRAVILHQGKCLYGRECLPSWTFAQEIFGPRLGFKAYPWQGAEPGILVHHSFRLTPGRIKQQ